MFAPMHTWRRVAHAQATSFMTSSRHVTYAGVSALPQFEVGIDTFFLQAEVPSAAFLESGGRALFSPPGPARCAYRAPFCASRTG